MAILGFEEKISGSVELWWFARRGDLYVRRLFIAPDPNHENLKLLSLEFCESKFAPAGAPLEFFSVERGVDGCGPGQPLQNTDLWGGIRMDVGNQIVMKLAVDPIWGEIRLRGMFEVSDATGFEFSRTR